MIAEACGSNRRSPAAGSAAGLSLFGAIAASRACTIVQRAKKMPRAMAGLRTGCRRELARWRAGAQCVTLSPARTGRTASALGNGG
jgi:hypothetical protein